MSKMRPIVIISILICLVCSLCMAEPSLDWPNWRGPQKNGISSETDWSCDWPAQGPTVRPGHVRQDPKRPPSVVRSVEEWRSKGRRSAPRVFVATPTDHAQE